MRQRSKENSCKSGQRLVKTRLSEVENICQQVDKSGQRRDEAHGWLARGLKMQIWTWSNRQSSARMARRVQWWAEKKQLWEHHRAAAAPSSSHSFNSHHVSGALRWAETCSWEIPTSSRFLNATLSSFIKLEDLTAAMLNSKSQSAATELCQRVPFKGWLHQIHKTRMKCAKQENGPYLQSW